MTAFDTAVKWWKRRCEEPFEDALGWHMRYGWVHAEPDMFLMAYEAAWDGNQIQRDGKANTWFVYMACMVNRSMADLFKVVPYPREFVAWCRRGGRTVKVSRWDKLIRRIR
jgi:hypothetical protein